MVEHDGADVVQVAQQGEETAAQLVVPHLDLVVIAARHKEGLRVVEVHAAHGALVLLVLFQQRAHAVVPQLQHAIVQRGQDPGALGVEAQPLDAIAWGRSGEGARRGGAVSWGGEGVCPRAPRGAGAGRTGAATAANASGLAK